MFLVLAGQAEADCYVIVCWERFDFVLAFVIRCGLVPANYFSCNWVLV